VYVALEPGLPRAGLQSVQALAEHIGLRSEQAGRLGCGEHHAQVDLGQELGS
jgi:hypothetical protein